MVAPNAATVPGRTAPGAMSRRTEGAIRDVLDGRPGGRGRFLLFAGPAVTASIAYMDPGNFATNIQAGARYGYGLLWVVLLANLTAMLFQALSAKLGIVTGKNLAEHCRDATLAPGAPRPVGRSARSPPWPPTSPSSWAAPSGCRCSPACR